MAKAYRVNLTAEALADLRGIDDYVSVDSPQHAAKLVERILDTADSINQMPDRFKQVGHSRGTGSPVHAVVATTPYILYYRIQQDPPAVSILMIRHGRRKPPRKFR